VGHRAVLDAVVKRKIPSPLNKTGRIYNNLCTVNVCHIEGFIFRYIKFWLDDRGSRVRFPVRAENFSLHHRVQNGSGAHPDSYPTGTGGSFPGGKAAGA
jgi:hypothetical protein